MSDHLLQVEGLVKHFPVRGGALNRIVSQVQAVNGVSFTVRRGEVLGLVGESGSGKTTVGRLVLRLEDTTAGKVVFDGTNVLDLSKRDLRRFRKRIASLPDDEGNHHNLTQQKGNSRCGASDLPCQNRRQRQDHKTDERYA